MAETGRRISDPNYRATFLGQNTLSLLGVDTPDTITIVNDWRRLGSETYVTDFTLGSKGEQQHLIAKACIKLSPSAVVEEWLDRRKVLDASGVLLPRLIAVESATIIEEFIPYEFREAYWAADTGLRGHLGDTYVDTYKKIRYAGFRPLSLHDVRSHGDDVVVIDLGEDLGGYTGTDSSELDQVSVASHAAKSLAELIGRL